MALILLAMKFIMYPKFGSVYENVYIYMVT